MTEFFLIGPILIGLVSILVIVTFFNLISSRRIKPIAQIAGSVAVLIPMRNEEGNARACVESALAQDGIEALSVLVMDDASTDDTFKLLSSLNDPRLTAYQGGELPTGWLGKNYALQSIANRANSKYLVFIDADVRLERNAISSSIELMERLELDYICPYPRQLAGSIIEKLVQPLLQWSWFATLPLIIAERSLRSSTVVANGQFFIVRAEAYFASGGHESIKSEVLDDMELARQMRRNGFRGTVVDGSQVANCRMYANGSELKSGYLKSQWRAFGGTFGALVAIKIMFLTSIAPLLLAIFGWKLGWLCYLAVVLTRIGVAIRTRSSLVSACFHPLAISLWIYLIFRSLWLKRTNQLTWRGRQI